MTQDGCDPLLGVSFSPSGHLLAILSRSAVYLYQVIIKQLLMLFHSLSLPPPLLSLSLSTPPPSILFRFLHST